MRDLEVWDAEQIAMYKEQQADNEVKKPPERNLSFGWLQRLLRNYSFADKQERTAGRSKVVESSSRWSKLSSSRSVKARYMLRLFTNLHNKFYFMCAAARQRQHRENGLY